MHLPPELVLLLFLPALLYWESLTTSLREIRANLRGIVLLSTVLVIATASAVAVVAHTLGLPLGPAWVLGAALAPTDATAVGVVARLLPRGQVTVLRAESLVNDGTALVIYGLAVGVTVGEEQLGAAHVGWLFLLAYVGGAVAGAVTGRVAAQVRRRQTDPLTGQVTMMLIPFTAFLLVSAFAGFRGAVSLAAALAVPHQLASGAPFPNRDMIVSVTGGVIVLTLLQGLLLPGVVRWARLPRDTAVETERHLAETRAAEEALLVLVDQPGLHGRPGERCAADAHRAAVLGLEPGDLGDRVAGDQAVFQ
ncbi:hypothetical protein ALI22I_14035 [Saccharothrix sp. ALI-22-I]|nr:hypothetical protein ALI22I_14035 [Saccharothrix sp. ALI-22-I]